jgi:uncharacterized protein
VKSTVQLPSPLPPRLSWPDLPLLKAPRLGHGIVQGRMWAHDPEGVDALALLSGRAWQLVQASDGRKAAEVIADLQQSHGGTTESWLAELPLLWRNGLVRSPGVPARRPQQKAERVFNTWIHLTNACNLACPYCYIHKSKNHMSDHVVERVLAAIAATAKQGQVERIHVRYAGGEPMLRFEAMQAFHSQATAICSEFGVQFSGAVLTNGAVVPKGAPEWLLAQGVSVSMSIDGVGELQDVMRPVVGGGSSFARVQKGLDTYLSYGIRPYILVTVGDSNLDGLPDLTRFLLDRGLGFRYSLVRDMEWGETVLDDRHGAEIDRSQEKPEGSSGILQGPPLRRLQKVLGDCYDLIEQAVTAQAALPQAPALSFRRSHRFCDLELWQPIAQACGAGRSYVAIGDEGQVSPCQAALHREGTLPISADSLLDQAKSQVQFGDFHRQLGNPVCNRCPHKPSCAGGCPLLLHRREGHVNGRSPYCEVFKAVIPRIVRIAAVELLGEQRRRQAQGQTAQAAEI